MTSLERELYTMLCEEASEVIQSATKILRFGEDSFNPYKPEDGTNIQQLREEVVDILSVIEMLKNVSTSPIKGPSEYEIEQRIQKKLNFLVNEDEYLLTAEESA